MTFLFLLQCAVVSVSTCVISPLSPVLLCLSKNYDTKPLVFAFLNSRGNLCAVRQCYFLSHLLLQIKIPVRVHENIVFFFDVMRIQLKSHNNKSHPPLVSVKNLYCFLFPSGSTYCILLHLFSSYFDTKSTA